MSSSLFSRERAEAILSEMAGLAERVAGREALEKLLEAAGVKKKVPRVLGATGLASVAVRLRAEYAAFLALHEGGAALLAYLRNYAFFEDGGELARSWPSGAERLRARRFDPPFGPELWAAQRVEDWEELKRVAGDPERRREFVSWHEERVRTALNRHAAERDLRVARKLAEEGTWADLVWIPEPSAEGGERTVLEGRWYALHIPPSAEWRAFPVRSKEEALEGLMGVAGGALYHVDSYMAARYEALVEDADLLMLYADDTCIVALNDLLDLLVVVRPLPLDRKIPASIAKVPLAFARVAGHEFYPMPVGVALSLVSERELGSPEGADEEDSWLHTFYFHFPALQEGREQAERARCAYRELWRE